MATGGYVGKILHVNLTDGTMNELATSDYEEYGGGFGMGSAVFWDLCKDKIADIDGFHPDNAVALMTSPFAGTLTPSASGRCDVVGIGVQAYPTAWFTRSNFGGRFSSELKYAGWDGVVVTGKAENPVWINIVNGKVTIEDAADVWGLDTHAAQQKIWSILGDVDGEWRGVDTGRDSGRTTQKPAVVTIGVAGENLARSACLLHDAGNGAGQGGFGAVFGAKNLKAISVVGTGSVAIADPAALLDIRQELQDEFTYDVEDPALKAPIPDFPFYGVISRSPGAGVVMWKGEGHPSRPQGCMGCFRACRHRWADGVANGDACAESTYWMSGTQDENMSATHLLDKLGINHYDAKNYTYLIALNKMGIAGPGLEIDTGDLPFDKPTSYEFISKYTTMIANREGIGDDLAEGYARAAVKWGRYDEDTTSGILALPNWGYSEHYDPRIEVEWSYGSILGDRDINEHGINTHVHWAPTVQAMLGLEPVIPAEEIVNLIAEGTGVGDPDGWDYSEAGIYSDAKVKAIAWHRHYTRFWKQSMGMCDTAWPMLAKQIPGDDHSGASPEYEVRMYEAVTGKALTYEESLEIGRKIWNLNKAIWVLQGRHRDQEVHAGY
ncbi:MAG: aldehyde ferredoxin oxidoreductase N-terminal domain-containing protein, partial [Coriobacteriia bacterium]|nr:aldehyde ferredoxin oxidoreductase N-terminal domain-containing protein [Coriobacteriia bacterium]